MHVIARSARVSLPCNLCSHVKGEDGGAVLAKSQSVVESDSTKAGIPQEEGTHG